MPETARFTPGPWEQEHSRADVWNVEPDGGGDFSSISIIDQNDNTIALVVAHDASARLQRANAHLIAASPDLYAVAKLVKSRRCADFTLAEWQMIDAALSRADGVAESNSPEAQRALALQASAEALGWQYGGDWPGFWFHRPTWGGWKNAASWAGTDNEPQGPDMKTTIYDTLPELVKGEGIELSADVVARATAAGMLHVGVHAAQPDCTRACIHQPKEPQP